MFNFIGTYWPLLLLALLIVMAIVLRKKKHIFLLGGKNCSNIRYYILSMGVIREGKL